MKDPICTSAGIRPDAIALDDGSRVWTYTQLDVAVAEVARRLTALGSVAGTMVALIAHPNALAIQTLFAIPRTGAVMVILNPKLGSVAMRRALDMVNPDLVLSTEADICELALDYSWSIALDDLPGLQLGRKSVEGKSGSVSDPRSRFSDNKDCLPEIDMSNDFAFLWTSGTSSTPRVVPVTMSALNESALAVSTRMDLRSDDSWYASLSLGHIGGLALVHRALYLGSCLVVRGSYSVDRLAQLIDDQKITHASLVPVMLGQLMDVHRNLTGPSSLRCLLIGGATVSRSLMETAMESGYPVAFTYGMTETCSQVAVAPPDLVAKKPGTVGFPLDGVELRIEENGEIFVRGPTVARSFGDEEGWFATGDLGSFDKEGHLWITGRMDDRIISGGTNVDFQLVEDVIRDFPGISDVAIVGVPDHIWGDVVGALVVPGSETLDLQALKLNLRERISSSEIPRLFAVTEEIPRNPNGKLDRIETRARLIEFGSG